jgi:triacylglycerol esterase/lipase EstA (alpha/beta hydrolase family)
LQLGLLSQTGYCQTTRVVPWSDSSLTRTSPSVIAYHPEPIIFVHGITANRTNWTSIINNLWYTNHWFDSYHYILDLVSNAYESANAPAEADSEAESQWIAIEQPYLHTFNYGRDQYRGPAPALPLDTYTVPSLANTIRLRHSRQSHDPVEWNSWQVPANDYLNGRVTLRQRIEDPVRGIRAAYQMPWQTNAPNVILIGHSLGGLVVCDYLQRKNANLGSDPGNRGQVSTLQHLAC